MGRRIRYKRGRFITFVILIILVVGLAVFSVFEFSKTDALSRDLAAAQEKSSSLSSQLEASKQQNKSLQDDYDSLQKQLSSLQSQYDALQSQDTANQTSAETKEEAQSSDEKVAYLTFDDGPSSVTTRLLDVLDDLDVKATFFVAFGGSDTPEKRNILKKESDAGHVVGVHTWTHDYYTIYANEQNFLDDFNKMKEVITESTGKTPNVSRFPGGASNTVSITASGGEVIMPRLAELVHDMGFQFFDWNAGGYDAETPYPSSDELAGRVVSDAEGRDTVVILLHDTHDFTVDAIPDIVQELRSEGFTFKTLTPDSPAIQQPFAEASSS